MVPSHATLKDYSASKNYQQTTFIKSAALVRKYLKKTHLLETWCPFTAVLRGKNFHEKKNGLMIIMEATWLKEARCKMSLTLLLGHSMLCVML